MFNIDWDTVEKKHLINLSLDCHYLRVEHWLYQQEKACSKLLAYNPLQQGNAFNPLPYSPRKEPFGLWFLIHSYQPCLHLTATAKLNHLKDNDTLGFTFQLAAGPYSQANVTLWTHLYLTRLSTLSPVFMQVSAQSAAQPNILCLIPPPLFPLKPFWSAPWNSYSIIINFPIS